MFDLRCRLEGASASGGAGVERSRVPSAGTFFSSLMLVMIDSFVERDPSGPAAQIALALMKFLGVRWEKSVKRPARGLVPRKGGKLVFLTISLADESASFANESLPGYLRISRDASYDISALAGDLIWRCASHSQLRGSRLRGIFCGKSTLFGMEPGHFWRAARSFHDPMALTIWHGASTSRKIPWLIARVFSAVDGESRDHYVLVHVRKRCVSAGTI